MINVCILEPYSLSALARLKADPRVALTDDLKQAQVALVRSRIKVDKDFLAQAPQLKLVVSATSGFDHMDWQLAAKRDIITAHCPEANGAATAELTLSLMLALERDLVRATKNVRGNLWREGLQRPQGLAGRTLGVVGLGRVGKRVARLAQALDMHVIGHDPYVDLNALNIENYGFIELLRASDLVTLHVPLTKPTLHLMNQPTLNEMQSEAILINTCRGPVVDENDLLVALDEGTIAGAAMDVIEREPPPKGHRLLTHPKLLLTPHIGAFTQNAWDRSSQEAVEKVLRFLDGQPVGNALPLAEPWFAACHTPSGT
jgi:D-3-phosphoglycerate dehydrogenase